VADPQGGLGGSSPPYGLQPPLEQGELDEEKVKGEEKEEEEGFSPPHEQTALNLCLSFLGNLIFTFFFRAYLSIASFNSFLALKHMSKPN